MIVRAGLRCKSQRPKTMREPKQEQELEPEEAPPHLPLDIMPLVFRELEARDLCSCAQVSKGWRGLVYELPEAGFQRCFYRDYGEAAAAELASRRNWRDKYIAKTIDRVCHLLRGKAADLDELEDTSAALERSVQSSLVQLNQIDRTVGHRRWDLNQLLASVAGRASAHSDSALGREILAAARAELDCAAGAGAATAAGELRGGGGGGDKAEGRRGPAREGAPGVPRGAAVAAQLRQGWQSRLTGEVCRQLVEMSGDVAFWTDSLREAKAALKTLMESLSYVGECIRSARAAIQELRQKKASLEAATTYRHVMRRA